MVYKSKRERSIYRLGKDDTVWARKPEQEISADHRNNNKKERRIIQLAPECGKERVRDVRNFISI